jgi:hypothetical protein
MEGLVVAMTSPYPADRPRIEDVIKQFGEIRGSLTTTKLRSALVSKRAPWIIRAVQEAGQYVRTIRYSISRMPAVPNP